MAEYIELVRRYLRGDPEGYDGEFFSPSRTAFWEAFAPERASIPIYNGALGPGNVRLTGQFADGWVPNPTRTRSSRRRRGARRRRGPRRQGPGVDRRGDVRAHCGRRRPRARARRAAAEHIAYYLRDIPGYYDRAVGGGVRRRRRRGPGRPSTDAGAERVETGLDHLAVVGTP